MSSPTRNRVYVFNVDRWAAYAKQRFHSQGEYISNPFAYRGQWPKPTGKQRRRIKHKANRNGDYL
jgi:hypothetical protein